MTNERIDALRERVWLAAAVAALAALLSIIASNVVSMIDRADYAADLRAHTDAIRLQTERLAACEEPAP